MNFCILMGSPRPEGNTAQLLKPFVAELTQQEASITLIPLSEKKILPCLGCQACQHVAHRYGCVQEDDVASIMDAIMACDCLVLATPIYTWYCTAPMKAVLDRHFGLNKYYGSVKGSLWAGKQLAILATHGYEADDATGPFKIGMERLCKHSRLTYRGLYSVRDREGLASFQTEAAMAGARAFARSLLAGDPSKPLTPPHGETR